MKFLNPMSVLPTPNFSHLREEPFKDTVYEPSEDTFLLLDALESQISFFKSQNISTCLEIGCGGGLAITTLATLLHDVICFATDINPFAAEATEITANINNANVNVVRTSFANGFRQPFDVILCNPPYVASETFPPTIPVTSKGEEKGKKSSEWIDLAWAGGPHGRSMIDLLLSHLPSILSPHGTLFLVLLIHTNNSQEVCAFFENSECIATRRFGIEHLGVYKLSGLKKSKDDR